MVRGFYNTTIETSLPNTVASIKQGIIDYDALRQDLQSEKSRAAINYLNHYYPGARSLIVKTRKNLNTITDFVAFDNRWGDPKLWQVIESESRAFTLTNYKKIFNSFDNVYFKIISNTIYLSCLITIVTVLLAYPLAYYMTTVKNKILFTIILFCVLLPFFTSYLSRLVAWLVLLQSNGIINNFIDYLNLEVQLIYNTTGIFIGSVYILLPMAVLPIYNSMKTVNIDLIKVAKISGANNIQIFKNIYYPLTSNGVYSAVLLCFMTVVGFYTTPAFLGGGKGKFITEQIVYHLEITLNWGLATALTGTLFFIVIILFLVYAKLNAGKHYE
jgi:putative spermidine/putrescine transport system permease protein